MVDNRFKITVVGSFATGKKSVVNALLGEDILPPYSFCINTSIQHGNNNHALIQFNQNAPRISKQTSINKITNHIHKFINQPIPPLAINIDEVYDLLKLEDIEKICNKIEYYCPSKFLKNNNAIEIVQQTYETSYYDECINETDLVLYIISADRPCSYSDMEFIESIYSRVKNILFVINRWDCIRKNEIDSLKTYINEKLQKYSNNEVLYVSALEKSGISTLAKQIEIIKKDSNNIVEDTKEKENYFSWSNISEMADIDSHIQYASHLLNQYEWNADTKNNLIRQLNVISNKQNEKLLNISVIGEFSTGKSSFINALIGYELLAVNVLQGTTVAITIIEYGKDFSVTLYDSKGNASIKKYQSIKDLSTELYTYTTESSYAKKINHIKVTLPSEILKNGFRIIDTPGTNSLELWHEDITRRAISEMSDLSIVLMNAQQPMPETLLMFIEDTLGYTIKDCAFIANKIDLIKGKERNGIIQYIETKAKYAFEIEKPIVLPFSSVALTNFFTNENIKVDDDSFMLTTNSLQTLLSHTAKRKVQAQARKILCLIDEMYLTLTNDINKIAENYNQQLQLLERTKQTDLRPFIKQQIVERQNSFNNNIIEVRNQVLKTSHLYVLKAIDVINTKIQESQSLDKLSNYIKNSLSQDIILEGEDITNNIEVKYSEVKKIFTIEIKEFQKAFEKEFEKLKILPTIFNISPEEIVRKKTTVTANIAPVTALITEELSNENWAFGGGAAAGAAIGTMIAPGIGTAIGVIVGFIAGGTAAPDTNKVKDKIKNKLSIPLKSYFNSISSDSISNFETYVNDANSNLEKEINRYLSKYNAIIQEEIIQWEHKRQHLNEKIKNIQIEIDSITARQHSIRNIVSNI